MNEIVVYWTKSQIKITIKYFLYVNKNIIFYIFCSISNKIYRKKINY